MIDLFAAVLRGAPSAAGALARLPVCDVVTSAERHGVLPLLAERLGGHDASTEPLRAVLARRAALHAAADLVREAELHRVVLGLRAAHVDALLVKGVHLAYTVYARPDLRPRLDTDLLVRADSGEAAAAALRALDYTQAAQGGGDLVHYQSAFSRYLDGHPVHVVDLHWRLANPQAFGSVLSYEDLAAGSEAIPALAGARAPGLVHALLLACVHRVAHHPDDDHLIWMYDIDLLARRLRDGDWRALLVEADARGVGAVVGRGLSEATRRFATPVPSWVTGDARLDSAAARSAETAVFLSPRRRHIEVVAQDFKLLPTWSARSRFAWQHLFPGRRYMRTVYAPASHLPLPVLYVQRALRGARRWLARSGT